MAQATGGDVGVRDEALLESAIENIYATFDGVELYPTKEEKAARLGYSLISNHAFVDCNKGNFDAMAYRVLKELSQKYSIKYYVVLAYMPNKRKEYAYFDYTDTILPDGIETVPKRYAIVYRNNWMIHKSDFVVAYVTDHINSSSSKFVSLAEKQDKVVIHLNSIP